MKNTSIFSISFLLLLYLIELDSVHAAWLVSCSQGSSCGSSSKAAEGCWSSGELRALQVGGPDGEGLGDGIRGLVSPLLAADCWQAISELTAEHRRFFTPLWGAVLAVPVANGVSKPSEVVLLFFFFFKTIFFKDCFLSLPCTGSAFHWDLSGSLRKRQYFLSSGKIWEAHAK